jgi:hypothetical protein
VGDVSVTEGNSGARTADFTVKLSNASKSTVAMKVATVNGTATAPSDFTALPATVLSFASGQTSKKVSIALKPDYFAEPDETFGLLLASPIGAVIDDGTATATIVNDDGAIPAASVADASISEGGWFTTKSMVFTVRLSSPTQATVSLKYKTADGTASSSSDYSAKAATLSFAPGETSKTVSVTVKGDRFREPDETFQLLLSNPSNGLTISGSSATGTITNDD